MQTTSDSMRSSLWQRPLIKRLGLYLLVMLTSIGLLLWQWPQARFDASVLSMLPNHSVKALPPALEDGLLERLDRQVILVLGGPEIKSSDAQSLTQKLENSGLFALVQGKLSAEFMRDYGRELYQHRNALVTSELKQALAEGTRGAQVLAQLFSPFAGVSSQEIIHDPLLVVRDFQMQMLGSTGSKLQLKDGWLIAQDESMVTFYFIRAELKNAAFSLADNTQIVTLIETLAQDYGQQGLTLLSRGTVFYSHAAAEQAKSDVTVLGSTTVLLVFALIMAVFRSPLPVVLVLLSSVSGALIALAGTITIFGGIHLITLTLAISIVGVSVDYSLYYLTARMCATPKESALATLKIVQPAIIWALTATLISYAALALAPFPGIRQMAVFAVLGLSGACFTVLTFHPLLASYIKPVPKLPCQLLLNRCIAFYSRNSFWRKGLPSFFFIFSVTGILLSFNPHDDVSRFQQLPQHLVAADHEITALTGQSPEQKWLCVFADSPELVLEGLDQLRPELDRAQHDGVISGYQTLPLPSAKTQRANAQLLNTALPKLAQTLTQAGLAQELTYYPESTLSLEDYLKSPIALGFNLLCLEHQGLWGILIALHDLKDGALLAQRVSNLTDPAQVALIDRKAAFDELFSFYREVISWALLGALGIIALVFIVQRGVKQGLYEFMPALISLLFAVGAPSLLGFDFTFFSLLSLVLVLGVGINYALFFTKTSAAADTTLLAVTLAMLTTLLTLGVLVFSHTEVIRSFGVTLVCGLSCAFILAPLLINCEKEKEKKHGEATSEF